MIKGSFTQSVAELERSSKRCHLCWIRLSRVSHEGRYALPGQDVSETEDEDYEFHFSSPEDTKKSQHSSWLDALRSKRLFRNLSPVREPGLQPRSSTQDPKTFELIDTWITTCNTQHQACVDRGLTQNAQYRPKRILDLGSNYASGNIHLRLGESLKAMTDFRYMTLSHRWGNVQPLQLRASTAAQLYEGFSVQDLPPLFRDIVEIARRLNVQYIWIDSLCIEQDSKEDWNMVTADMGAVYSNSWLNIAAVSARNCQDGCFTSRPDFGLLPLRVKYPGVSSCVFQAGTDYSWMRDVSDSLFTSRAWILQERYLSPRALFFTGTEVYWECCESCCSESKPEVFRPGDSYTGPLTRTKLNVSETMDKPDHRFAKPGRTRIWMEIVEEYSRCTLTNVKKDRFAAIAGIAGSLGPPEDYIAGLWLTDLLPLLVWHVSLDDAARNPAGTIKKPSVELGQLAPSWSWLSIDSPIIFASELAIFQAVSTPMAVLLDAHVELLDVRYPFCDIHPGGYIVLSAHIFSFYPGSLAGMNMVYSPDNSSPVLDPEPLQRCAVLYGSKNEFQGICIELIDEKGTYRRTGQVTIRSIKWDSIDRFFNGQVVDEESYIERLAERTYRITGDVEEVRLTLPTYKIKIV